MVISVCQLMHTSIYKYEEIFCHFYFYCNFNHNFMKIVDFSPWSLSYILECTWLYIFNMNAIELFFFNLFTLYNYTDKYQNKQKKKVK